MVIFFEKSLFILELLLSGSYISLYSIVYISKSNLENISQLFSNLTPHFSYAIPIILICSLILKFKRYHSLEKIFRLHLFSIIVIIPLLITYGDLQFLFWLSSSHLLYTILSLYDPDSSRTTKEQPLLKRVNELSSIIFSTTSKKIMISFATFILFGAMLLMLPVASHSSSSIPFVDALFVSSSAVSTTGLSTISIGGDLTLFGQFVILALVQIGAIGLMTLTSSLAIILGKSISMKERLILQDVLEANSIEELTGLVTDIIKYTLFIELWGAIILSFAFLGEGFEMTDALYQALFHSVSAFCTAGFSLFDTSLESFATNSVISLTISALSILGGLGFITLKELKIIFINKNKNHRLSLHSKVNLIATTILVGTGSTIIFFNEFLNTLDPFNLWDKIHIALFQFMSAMTTAGFNTITYSSMKIQSICLIILTMFIGASPGSTAGGVKITTIVVMIQSIKATLTGSDEVILFDRVIPRTTVIRAISVFLVSTLITCLFFYLMLQFEPENSFVALLFETVSAFGTVGLSLGITAQLSLAGKILLSLLMYIGRIGPLALVLAFGEKAVGHKTTRYPTGKIMIG